MQGGRQRGHFYDTEYAEHLRCRGYGGKAPALRRQNGRGAKQRKNGQIYGGRNRARRRIGNRRLRLLFKMEGAG